MTGSENLNSKIIYLHGFASGPQSSKASAFREQFSELGVSVEFPDLEGGDFENLNISNQMAIIEKVIDDCPESRLGLIGSSMGGYLALLNAQRFDRITAIYLMCPGLNFIQRWSQRLLKENPEWEEIPSTIRTFNYRHNREMDFNTAIFKDAKTWEQVSLSRSLPTRIVHGIHDEVVPVSESRKFAKDRDWVRLEELDSDHGLLSHLDWILKDGIEFFSHNGFYNPVSQ